MTSFSQNFAFKICQLPSKHYSLRSIHHRAIAILLMIVMGPVFAVPVTYYETIIATQDPFLNINLNGKAHETLALFLYFRGDTDNVKSYTVNRTSGFEIKTGDAWMEILDIGATDTVRADFLPGEVFVGTDITNGGLGFGSRVYPVYPYALIVNSFRSDQPNLSDPTYDLTHDFRFSYLGLSCVGLKSGDCVNINDAARNYTLATTSGDFWIESQGLQYGAFSVAVQVPEFNQRSSLLLGISMLLLMLAINRKHLPRTI